MQPADIAFFRAFVESGVSVQVGTRDSSLFPETVRAVGLRFEDGGEEATVFVPAATGARTVANLRDNGRIAVCLSRIEDHRTFQLKGRARSIEAATAADREAIDRYRATLASALAFIGLPVRVSFRIAHWPCTAVRFAIESSFVQTPGPGAGDALVAEGAP